MAFTGVKISKTSRKYKQGYIGQVILAGRIIMTMSSSFSRTWKTANNLMKGQDAAFRRTIQDINTNKRLRVRANSNTPVIEWGAIDFKMTTGTDIEGDRMERSIRMRGTLVSQGFCGQSKAIYDFELDELFPDIDNCAALLSAHYGTPLEQITVPEGQVNVELVSVASDPGGTA